MAGKSYQSPTATPGRRYTVTAKLPFGIAGLTEIINLLSEITTIINLNSAITTTTINLNSAITTTINLNSTFDLEG